VEGRGPMGVHPLNLRCEAAAWAREPSRWTRTPPYHHQAQALRVSGLYPIADVVDAMVSQRGGCDALKGQLFALCERQLSVRFRLEFRTPVGVGKSTVPETRGPRAVRYGDFVFGPTGAAADDAGKRTDARADRPIAAWRGGHSGLVRPLAAGGRPLMGGRYADVPAAGSVAAAGGGGVWPCRVMAQGSRVDWHDVAGHAAGSGVQGSR
jgi:hypothetical protein